VQIHDDDDDDVNNVITRAVLNLDMSSVSLSSSALTYSFDLTQPATASQFNEMDDVIEVRNRTLPDVYMTKRFIVCADGSAVCILSVALASAMVDWSGVWHATHYR